MTGHELKTLRLALRWSQTHMADYFDVDYNTVHKWETMDKVPRIVELGQKELIGMIGMVET
jgi:DNA-binding transcriptional regulator YiaG